MRYVGPWSVISHPAPGQRIMSSSRYVPRCISTWSLVLYIELKWRKSPFRTQKMHCVFAQLLGLGKVSEICSSPENLNGRRLHRRGGSFMQQKERMALPVRIRCCNLAPSSRSDTSTQIKPTTFLHSFNWYSTSDDFHSSTSKSNCVMSSSCLLISNVSIVLKKCVQTSSFVHFVNFFLIQSKTRIAFSYS